MGLIGPNYADIRKNDRMGLLFLINLEVVTKQYRGIV